ADLTIKEFQYRFITIPIFRKVRRRGNVDSTMGDFVGAILVVAHRRRPNRAATRAPLHHPPRQKETCGELEALRTPQVCYEGALTRAPSRCHPSRIRNPRRAEAGS